MSSSSSSAPLVSFASADGDLDHVLQDCRAAYTTAPLLTPLFVDMTRYGRAVVDVCTAWLVRASNRELRLYGTFVDQIVRASTSMSKNVAEGLGHATLRQRIKCHTIARGSLLETLTFLEYMPAFGDDGNFRARLLAIDAALTAEATAACRELEERFSRTRRVEDRKTVAAAREHLSELARPLPPLHAEAVALARSTLAVIEEWSVAQAHFDSSSSDTVFARVHMPLLAELVKHVTATSAHIAEGHGSFSRRRNFQFVRMARATSLITLTLMRQLPPPFSTSLESAAQRLLENVTELANDFCLAFSTETFAAT